MKKPDGYDESQAFSGESERLEAGGYICKIKQAVIEKSTTGKEMMVLLFDIAEGEHAGFYQRLFDTAKASAGADAKWKGIFRQLTEGKSTPFFKGLITSIEQSNSGYKWNWDEIALKGKIFGGVFGREQYRNSVGSLKWSTKLMYVRSVDAVRKGVEIPEDKYLQGEATSGNAAPGSSQFTDLSDDDGDLPF